MIPATISEAATSSAGAGKIPMEFTGDIALWQQRIAEVTRGARRRAAPVDALEITPGQTILDIGCGGGEITRKIGARVGPQGRAIGFDRSSEQLSAARKLCTDAPWIELVEGDAVELPFEDASVDGFMSINTLEYILDVDRALAEARRVLKPGGRASIMSVLWDVWQFYGPEPELNRRVLDAWRAHCPHQTLPIELPAKMRPLGYDRITREPFAVLEETFDENSYGYWVCKVVAAFVSVHGVSSDDAQRWLDQLGASSAKSRFAFFQASVLTTATAC